MKLQLFENARQETNKKYTGSNRKKVLKKNSQILLLSIIQKYANTDYDKRWSICNRNNNNENDEGGIIIPSTENEFLISDDEDNINIRMSLMNKMLKVKTKLSKISNKNVNKLTPRSKKAKDTIKRSLQNITLYMILTTYNITSKLPSKFFYLIYNLPRIKCVFKNTKNHLTECIKKLCDCFYLNTFGLNFSHLQRRPNAEEDSIMKKINWSMWLFSLIFILVLFLGCQHANSQAYINRMYQIGTSQLMEVINFMKYNLYNLPGSACMFNENCCTTNGHIVKRWFYCFFTLPYRVSSTGIYTPIIKKESLENILENLSDWRLRRNVHRLKMIIKDIRSKIFIIDRKAYQAEIQFQYIKCDGIKNLTNIPLLVSEEEQLENENQKYIKNLRDMSSKTNILYSIKENLENENAEVKQCTKCSAKKLTTDIEKRAISNTKIIEEISNKIKTLKIKADEKLKHSSLDQGFDNLKNEISLLQNSNNKWLSKLPHLEGLNSKFRSDIEFLTSHIMNRSRIELSKVAQRNKDLLKQNEKLFSLNHDNLNHVFSKGKLNITEMIKDLYIIKYKYIKNNIIEGSCPKITEYVRMTILSILTLAQIKSCGVIGRVTYSNQTCLKNMFKYFDKSSQELNCCRKKSEVLERINESLEIFNSDYLGLVDYASHANGGQILESLTTTSFYYRELEESDGISFLSTISWKPWLLFSKKIINSVQFLNYGKVQAGRCWKFKGNFGSTVIKLDQIILVTAVSLEHIHPNLSLSKYYSDAPRRINIHSLENESDSQGILLGDFYFDDLEEYSIQQFMIKEPVRSKLIMFTVKSNHGSNYTCVYRLRIHGLFITK